MKSFRQTMLAICVILIASAFAGCGADTDLPDKRPALGKIEYTNLNDSGSRELLQGLLSGAGVSDGRIQSFFRRVDRFNDSVKQEWLTDGFEEAELLYTKYDPYAMQDEWTAKNGTFPGYNCRITAMSLFGDFLSVSVDSQINAGEDVLFVDAETLKTDPDALGGSSLADFRALYSSMKAEDTTEIMEKMVDKLLRLRIFSDENDKINLSLQDVGGSLLLVSQFTLYADCRKGNRPSFVHAAPPAQAEALYEACKAYCRERVSVVESGIFGADMQVVLCNDGPFTVLLDSAEIIKN